jgi:hypothetical protein
MEITKSEDKGLGLKDEWKMKYEREGDSCSTLIATKKVEIEGEYKPKVFILAITSCSSSMMSAISSSLNSRTLQK